MALIVMVGILANLGTYFNVSGLDDVVNDVDESIEEDVEPGDVVNLPEFYIKAVNPGYTVDGKSNVGEMIEIGRRESDELISLAGLTVGYTNSSGNSSIIFEFPENSWMVGESVLLRLASSPESGLANSNYTKTLAFSAEINLSIGEEVIDAVCWTGKKDCYKEFKSSKPTVLLRNLETGKFEHVAEYEPAYNPDNYYLEMVEEEYAKLESQCKGITFSELLSYYETSKSEQYIEFYNTTAERVSLDGCQIRYKNKSYLLSGVVEAEGYRAYYPTEFSLTKNPTNGNTLELIDVNGEVVAALKYPNGQKKGTAYAWIGYDEKGGELWKVTYTPTPGEPNNYQEFRTCEEGKIINEATGNCVKASKITSKVCPKGQYLNVLTGRCKKNETVKEKTCKDGYYLNPDTGRCRKIVENKGADYSLEPEKYEESSSFVALYAVLGVMGIGMIYLVFEFRHEIKKLWHKVFRRSH